MFRRSLFLLMAGFGGALSCTPPGPSNLDSWYTSGHPSGVELSDRLATSWRSLDPSLFFEVSSEGRAEAEQMLSSGPLLRVMRDHAQKLTLATLPDTSRKLVCLVRGVHLNRKTGAFRVYSKGDVILVHHESRGSGRIPMGRQPLIVLLETIPSKVWVGCTMSP